MQLSLITLAALSISSTIAQSTVVHVVTVGGNGNKLTFVPNNLVAATGDMVQFQFGPNNHTVTQSAFETPCQPLTTTDLIYSGYMPVTQPATNVPTYTVMVKDQNPIWLFCSQGKHCAEGMVMVINEPKTDTTKTLALYTAAAKTATTVQVGGGLTNAGTNNGGTASAGAPAASAGATPATGTTGSATAQQPGVASPQVAAGASPLAIGDFVKLAAAVLGASLFLI